MPATRDRLNQRNMILFVRQSSGSNDMERNRRGFPCIALRFRSESRFVSVGNHVQFRSVSVGTQQTCAKFGGHMHMVDFAIQPQIEQPVDKRVDTRNIFQRARRYVMFSGCT